MPRSSSHLCPFCDIFHFRFLELPLLLIYPDLSLCPLPPLHLCLLPPSPSLPFSAPSFSSSSTCLQLGPSAWMPSRVVNK